MSANWRGKIGVLAISCKKICPLIGGSANCVSTFWKLFYEDLTRKPPGKMKLSANQRCPPFRVSVNWRFHCTVKREIQNKNNNKWETICTMKLKNV